MNYYPMVWLLWEYEEGEKYLEGAYAHKIMAEEVLRLSKEAAPKNHYWIQEAMVEQRDTMSVSSSTTGEKQ